MKGEYYEQFVRGVLIERLQIAPDDLKSTREAGVTFPDGKKLKHQIDLYYVDGNEVAEYITIIECKYRTNGKIDQEEVAKLAYVKGSIKASKAIMVTNQSFTSGANALAEAENIALLVIKPEESLDKEINSTPANEIFDKIQKRLKTRNNCYSISVECRFLPDPNQSGLDIVESLLQDPTIREKAEEIIKDPEVRRKANEFLSNNPDIADKARDFLRNRRW